MDLAGLIKRQTSPTMTARALLDAAGIEVHAARVSKWVSRQERIPSKHVVALLAVLPADLRAEVACAELGDRLAVTDLPDMLTRILGADDLLRASTAKALGITEATLRTWAAVAAGREA